MRILYIGLSLWAALLLAPLTRAAADVAADAAPPQAEAPQPSRLGPEDQVSIRVLDDDEIPEKAYRVDAEGFLDLPLVGRLQATGRTTREIEADLTEKLRAYIKDPRVTITLVESHSRPVSVLGAVGSPGVHQIDGPKRLLEVLSLAGGLRPDAGTTVRLTRPSESGEIPLPNARQDLSRKFSVVDIDLDSLMRGKTPEQNILIRPQDVITVTKADLVYVLGEVKKAGGFPILAHERISILTALSLAEGMTSDALLKNSRILRENSDGPNRIDIPVNISKIMAGQAPDVPLQPNDIVVVPKNVARAVAIKTAEAALAIGTGLIIFKR